MKNSRSDELRSNRDRADQTMDHATTPTAYDKDFYENQSGGSQRSADVIVLILMDAFRIQSAIDVGCGVGTWLNAFAKRGVDDVTGLDGDYVSRDALAIPADRFHATDLTSDFRIDRRYDTACSLEVAEHLPAEAGPRFVAKLCQAAPVVLFSAAIPGQSGTHHINEAWQDTWRREFAKHGYQPLDIVRPKVWGNDEVEWWYQQNTIVYVDAETLEKHPELMPVDIKQSLDAVHPACYSKHVADNHMYLSKAIKRIPGLLEEAVKRRAKHIADKIVSRTSR